MIVVKCKFQCASKTKLTIYSILTEHAGRVGFTLLKTKTNIIHCGVHLFDSKYHQSYSNHGKSPLDYFNVLFIIL